MGVIAKILDMKLLQSQKLLSNVIAGNASILQVETQILLWYFLKIRLVTVQEMLLNFLEKIWKHQLRVIFVINAAQQLERRVHPVLIQ